MLLKDFYRIKEAINEILSTTILGKVDFAFQVIYVDKEMEGVRMQVFKRAVKI